jgi:hypothetical protein
MENNFIIDFAKTLYKPTRPKHINKIITSYTKSKTPHFFIYAKDKDDDKVEETNSSAVNRLEKIIPNPIINFRIAKLGNFDYKMLMKNKEVELNDEIIDLYTRLDLKKKFMINSNDNEFNNVSFIYKSIKQQLLKINKDIDYVTDVLIEYLYVHKNSNFKTTLWECFGEVIVRNLKLNIEDKFGEGSVICEVCTSRIEAKNNRKKYCNDCWEEKEKELRKEINKKYYSKLKIKTV